jgi:hypothetical protein
MKNHIADLSNDKLKAELRRLRENLCDIEDMHAYSGKTSVHIGGKTAHKMQEEFEEECRELNEKIAEIEKELRSRGAAEAG